VDTLRWDAVSMLSPDEHSRDLTPNLRGLLGPRATVFSNAYTQAPWTLPAFASIFTGLYPEQHGAEHVWSQLGPEQTTLAELFREQGYLTMAVVSGHFVTSEVGMDQGFAMYDESLAVGRQLTTSAEVTDKALHFLEARRDQPFFLFAHYFDPHYPYLRHPEVDLGPARDDELLRLPVGRDARWWGKPAGRALAASSEGRLPYNEEVAYTDLHIGRLLAFLDEHQLWDDAYVVFVSDHGEEFFEHGGAGHDHTLYQELVHVPLCLATPSRALPEVVAEPVETRWLFQTLCEAAGRARSADRTDGPSLLSRGIDEQQHVRSSTCPRGRRGVEGSGTASVWLTSLTGERYKVIQDHARGRAMLFDLADDPRELRNVGEKRPDMAGELGRALAACDAELLRPDIAGAAPELGEHQLRRLRSLGYL
jgi:arylsulfatase A-like enzyme